MQALEMLREAGIAIVPTRLARSAAEAALAAQALGHPVALKIESPDLPHKTEAGGVRLGLGDAAQVRAAFDAVTAAAAAYAPRAAIAGVLVQAMARPGVELVLGVRRDPHYGPIVMVGLGGIFVEVFGDVVFGIPPLSKGDALGMLGRLRGVAILRGVRGRPAVDADALADALCALSVLAVRHPGIVELDLNPVFADEHGLVAVDWLMLEEPHA
jgi:acetyltransferase